MTCHVGLLTRALMLSLAASQLHAQERAVLRVAVAAPTRTDQSTAPVPVMTPVAAGPDIVGLFTIGGAIAGAVVTTVVVVRDSEVHDPIVFPTVGAISILIGTIAGGAVGFVVGEVVRQVLR